VSAACRERGFEELVGSDSEDLDEWDVLIGCLADAVLWDEDWKDAEDHLDVDPKAGRAVRKLLGIDEDYYVAVSRDPTD
jgi:hypothetical protein